MHLALGHAQVQPVKRYRLAVRLAQARHGDSLSHAGRLHYFHKFCEICERYVSENSGRRRAGLDERHGTRGARRRTDRAGPRSASAARRPADDRPLRRRGRRRREASRFIEDFASALIEMGVPRMPARVFAALLTTDSGRLTAAELAARLQVSPAAVSGAVRYLIQVGMVRRESEPGSRRHYYRAPNNVWDEAHRDPRPPDGPVDRGAAGGRRDPRRGHAGRGTGRRVGAVLRVRQLRAAARHRAGGGSAGRHATTATAGTAGPLTRTGGIPGAAGRIPGGGLSNHDRTLVRLVVGQRLEEAADVARDPGDLYQVSPDAPELDDVPMLYYLDGFIDAGGAGRLLTAHLLGALEHTEVARFDVDSLIDYRSRAAGDDVRQGPLGAATTRRRSRSRCCTTTAGTPFLLLNGPEPDHDWNSFTSARAQPGRDAAGQARGRVPRHPDGRAAHQAARRHRARDPGRTRRGLPAAGRPAAGAGQRGRAARAADGRGRARGDRVRGARAALPRPRPPTRRQR